MFVFHKGLTRAIVVKTAKELIEEKGYAQFSMRLLAETLGVKAASLYSHIESTEALFTEVGLLALKQQKRAQMVAMKGKRREEAVYALAEAYRDFAQQHRELYRTIMEMPLGNDAVLHRAAAMIADPPMQVLADFALDETQQMHWQRILRGFMHGFIAQEEAGYFAHFPIDSHESYHLAIGCFLEGLHQAEGKKSNE